MFDQIIKTAYNEQKTEELVIMRVLITGASSGIGRDMARVFAHKGYDLILVARDKEKLEELKQELEEKVYVQVESMDLSKEENCIKLYETYPEIDILINNAGFGVHGLFNNTDLEKEGNMIKTNVIAVHILTKLYLQEMMKKDEGKILNVASIAGFMPGPLMAGYYATKSYVVRLSESIRQELKKQKSKVQISILCPGPVDTNFNKVAEGKFNVHSMKSETVAKYAVEKLLKGKFLIIPGILMKLAKFFSKITPNGLVSKIVWYVH